MEISEESGGNKLVNSHKSLLLILFLILSMHLIYTLILKRGVPGRRVKKNMLNIVKTEVDEFSFAFSAMTFYCVAYKERVAQALTVL